MKAEKTLFYQKKLMALRSALVGDVEKTLKSSQEEQVETIPDISDEATRNHNSQLMQNLGDQDWAKFKLVEEALDKIKNGGYGICQRCERAIPEARLNIVPFAEFCVECKNEIEKEQAI